FPAFRRIREEEIPAEELEANKRSLVAGFTLSLEQPARGLGLAITPTHYGVPANYWEAYPEKIMAVTAEDVQRVARKYLDPNALQLVAVGNAERIKPILETYGTVEVFDANGVALDGAKP